MARDLPVIEYVSDFIYLDAARLTQYVAQLDPNGVLTGLKTSNSLAENFNATNRASIALVSGQMSEGGALSESMERTFDASWTLPFSVMDRLDELHFLSRDVTRTGVGHLLLTKGFLQILDIRMMKELWPFALKAAAAAAPDAATGRAAKQSPAAQKKIEAEIKSLSDGLKLLPHGLQLHFLTKGGVLWATLNPERMVVSSDDFILKHGSYVPGEWQILCIVDSFAPINAMEVWGSLGISQISTAMMQACEQIRAIFGRPEGTIAVTPLAIFRRLPATAAEAAPEPV